MASSTIATSQLSTHCEAHSLYHWQLSCSGRVSARARVPWAAHGCRDDHAIQGTAKFCHDDQAIIYKEKKRKGNASWRKGWSPKTPNTGPAFVGRPGFEHKAQSVYTKPTPFGVLEASVMGILVFPGTS